jgi:small subunit ribosomal protein S2
MIDLKKLIDAGVHFGHKTSRWSPKMASYIWGARNGIHLIDVSKTAFLLKKAGETLYELAKNGGQILLVGTKKSAKDIIKKTGLNLKVPYVVERWIGGTLTNNEQVKKAVTRLLHLRDVMGKSDLLLGKKELSMLTKEVARLERNVGGVIDLHYPPAALVIIDAKRENSAIREASYIGVPIVGLVDSNTNPEGVTCIIPGNDDSPRSVECIVEYLAEKIAAGIAEYELNKPAPTAITKATEKSGPRRPDNGPRKNDRPGNFKKAHSADRPKLEIAEPKVIVKAEPKKAVVVEKEVVAEVVAVETAPVAKKTPMKVVAKKAPAEKEVVSEEAAAKKPAAKAKTTPMKTKAAPAKAKKTAE